MNLTQLENPSEELSGDFDRYDIYAFNEPVVSVSSISIALQQYRHLSRGMSPRLREAGLKIYDNYAQEWIR